MAAPIAMVLENAVSVTVAETPIRTLADMLRRLGNVPLDRIRFHPAPGLATERDVLDVEQRENVACELIDGVLVEKGMGYRESILATALAAILRAFVRPRNLGIVSGPDGMMRLFPGLVRIPDVAFASWDRIPGRKIPQAPIPDLSPDLAVEVLSESNTEAEMQRKLREYFESDVRLVWLIDPKTRTVRVYTSERQSKLLTGDAVLSADEVLPGFQLALAELFAELDIEG